MYYFKSNIVPCLFVFFSDDDDHDMQGDRAVDYGKRHQAIDILWTGTHSAVESF